MLAPMPALTPHEWRLQFQAELGHLRPHLVGMLKLLATISMQEWKHQGALLAPDEAARQYHERQQAKPKAPAKRH